VYSNSQASAPLVRAITPKVEIEQQCLGPAVNAQTMLYLDGPAPKHYRSSVHAS